MPEIIDFIVVGSGPAGAQAAQTLVEAGHEVLMIDVGNQDMQDYQSKIPNRNYFELRKEDPNQFEYFLGKSYESIQWGKTQTGAQLTPSRRHILKDVNKITPLKSDNFNPMESLSYGGLGSGWGIGCCVFSDAEILRAGLDVQKLYKGYETVASRIGVTGSDDDATPYTNARLQNRLPAFHIDENSQELAKKYDKNRDKIQAKGFHLGRPSLALLTQDKGHRKATSYTDIDFYTDQTLSAYRPWITIDSLKKCSNFHYLDNQLALEYSDHTNGVQLKTINTKSKEIQIFQGKKLILAAGVLGTARIVLRSEKAYDQPIPILCNEYRYAPFLQLSRIGKVDQKPKHSFAQLAMFHDPDGKNEDVAMASMYSYGSLMLFRLIKEVPLHTKAASTLMRYLSPAITILGIHLPDSGSANNRLVLKKSDNPWSGDDLHADFRLSKEEKKQINQRLKLFSGAMRKMGCVLLKMIDPGHGSSIHYAGSLPYSDLEKPLHLHPNGRLHQTQNIYVADSSGFNYLPAKGITFSLMANAHNVAEQALSDLKNGK